jgi:hypothetical protein
MRHHTMDRLAVFVCLFIASTTRRSPERVFARPNSAAALESVLRLFARLETHANMPCEACCPAWHHIDSACIDETSLC